VGLLGLIAVPIDADTLSYKGWRLLGSVRNPWGQVPLTDGGRSLPSRAREYMDRLVGQQEAHDPVSRRHHYVPRAYLNRPGFGGGSIP
jgi:hypothetical protein